MRLPPVTRALIRRMFAHFEQREKLNAQTNWSVQLEKEILIILSWQSMYGQWPSAWIIVKKSCLSWNCGSSLLIATFSVKACPFACNWIVRRERFDQSTAIRPTAFQSLLTWLMAVFMCPTWCTNELIGQWRHRAQVCCRQQEHSINPAAVSELGCSNWPLTGRRNYLVA